MTDHVDLEAARGRAQVNDQRPGATPSVHRSTVFREPGRFAGWPANYGLWRWGEEVLAVFVVGWLGPRRGLHAADPGRPFVPTQARSTDGGRTWRIERFGGALPGSSSLSADEHLEGSLRAGPGLRAEEFTPLPHEIDFTDPETVVLCARTGLAAGAVSWFYVSSDRGAGWSGPHRLPDLGLTGLAARTDVVALGPREALFLLTAAKGDGEEGQVCCVRTGDGGRSFERRGRVGPEPEGWSIMPSSLRLPHGVVLTAVRRSNPAPGGQRHWIELFSSEDDGRSWQPVSVPVSDTGPAGNPPALVRTATGRLVLVWGQRSAPCGLRYVGSDDDGTTWSPAQILTDDVATSDMGYPRAVVMDDDTVLALYYANQGEESERHLEAVRWRP